MEREAAQERADLERRRELWRLAKQAEFEEGEEAAREVGVEREELRKLKGKLALQQLQQEIASSLFHGPRDETAQGAPTSLYSRTPPSTPTSSSPSMALHILSVAVPCFYTSSLSGN